MGKTKTGSNAKQQTVLLLMSKSTGDRVQLTNTERARTILNGKKIAYVEVDGSDPQQKDRRNELFGISGIRGNYPQFFMLSGVSYDASKKITTSTCRFLGDYEMIEGVNDSSEFSPETLQDNPEIVTWDTLLGE